jgi:DNA repair ATPase RecN
MNGTKKLRDLSFSLSDVHRSLLQFQKVITEIREESAMTPHQLLQNTLSHKDFEWLRKISKLMTRLDSSLDEDGDDAPEVQKQILKELHLLFNDENHDPEFNNRINTALDKDPNLCMQIIDFRKRLSAHR